VFQTTCIISGHVCKLIIETHLQSYKLGLRKAAR